MKNNVGFFILLCIILSTIAFFIVFVIKGQKFYAEQIRKIFPFYNNEESKSNDISKNDKIEIPIVDIINNNNNSKNEANNLNNLNNRDNNIINNED